MKPTEPTWGDAILGAVIMGGMFLALMYVGLKTL